MTEIKRRKVESILKKKGFEKEKTHKDHIWYVLIVNNEIEPKIKVHMSMGGHGENIRQQNMKKMALEMRMDNQKQFQNFINCPLSYDQYLDYLRKNNYI